MRIVMDWLATSPNPCTFSGAGELEKKPVTRRQAMLLDSTPIGVFIAQRLAKTIATIIRIARHFLAHVIHHGFQELDFGVSAKTVRVLFGKRRYVPFQPVQPLSEQAEIEELPAVNFQVQALTLASNLARRSS